MKTFAKAFGSFWTGATGKRLMGHGPYPKLLAWYFMTSPAALAADNYGVFYIEHDTILRHLECDPSTFLEAVTLLAEQQFAFWDAETEWVWVREAAAWQYSTPLLPKDYVCANARKWYRQLPRNPWLGHWFDRYLTDLNLQYDAERWVNRREWDDEPPAIAGLLRPRRKGEPLQQPEVDLFCQRAIERLRKLKLNGAIGVAIDAAIVKLEQGDVPLEVIDRQLLDAVLIEIGADIDREVDDELKKYRTRMPAEQFEVARLRTRDRIARENLRLPSLTR